MTLRLNRLLSFTNPLSSKGDQLTSISVFTDRLNDAEYDMEIIGKTPKPQNPKTPDEIYRK